MQRNAYMAITLATAAIIATQVLCARSINWHVDRATPSYEYELQHMSSRLEAIEKDTCEIRQQGESLSERLHETRPC
jgi:hypothetical protein